MKQSLIHLTALLLASLGVVNTKHLSFNNFASQKASQFRSGISTSLRIGPPPLQEIGMFVVTLRLLFGAQTKRPGL